MKKYVLLLLIIFLTYTYGFTIFKESSTFLHTREYSTEKLELNSTEVWIEVHDVSPGYGYEKLEDIIEVLERHPRAYSKVVLFIIPNHGGNSRLRDYPEYVKNLKKLEERGYILGLHGYAHIDPIKSPEFDCSSEEAEALIEASKSEFKVAGLEFPTYFLPPGWRTSSEADEVLRKKFDYVYYYLYIDTPKGTLPYHSREYIWHNLSTGGLEKAKSDYTSTTGVFRLALHIGAINTENGLRFLNDFLRWIEEDNISESE